MMANTGVCRWSRSDQSLAVRIHRCRLLNQRRSVGYVNVRPEGHAANHCSHRTILHKQFFERSHLKSRQYFKVSLHSNHTLVDPISERRITQNSTHGFSFDQQILLLFFSARSFRVEGSSRNGTFRPQAVAFCSMLFCPSTCMQQHKTQHSEHQHTSDRPSKTNRTHP